MEDKIMELLKQIKISINCFEKGPIVKALGYNTEKEN